MALLFLAYITSSDTIVVKNIDIHIMPPSICLNFELYLARCYSTIACRIGCFYQEQLQVDTLYLVSVFMNYMNRLLCNLFMNYMNRLYVIIDYYNLRKTEIMTVEIILTYLMAFDVY